MRSSTCPSLAWLLVACLASPLLAQSSHGYERITIIGDETRPDYQFGRIVAIAERANGEIVVLDGMNSVVRIYSPQGEFIRRFGRSGAGPGEFMFANGLLLTPQHILVTDVRLQRVSKFTYDGRLVETSNVAEHGVTADVVLPMRQGVWLAVKSVFKFGSVEVREILASSNGAQRLRVTEDQRRRAQSMVLTWTQNSNAAPDTLLRFDPGPVPYYGLDGARFGILPQGFGSAGSWTMAGDSLLGLVDGANGQVRILTVKGGELLTLRSGRVPITPVRVSAADLRKLELDARDVLELPSRIGLSAPTHRPLLGTPKFSPDGALWIRRIGPDETKTSDSGHRYLVVPLGGSQQREVRLPPGFVLYHVGDDRLIGKRQDELGVESVEVWRRIR